MATPVDPVGRLTLNFFTVQRLGTSIAGEASALLDELFEQIIADLERIDPTGPDLRKWRDFRTEAFLVELEKRLAEAIPSWERRVRDGLAIAARIQGEFARDLLIASLGDASDRVRPTPITQARARSILNSRPFEGATMREWAESVEETTRRRISREIKRGMIAEESLPELVRRVRGDAAGFTRRDPKTGQFVPKGTRGAVVTRRYTDGVWSATTRDAEAVVRSAVSFISTEAKLETYQENATLIRALQFQAVLDDRTCFVAGTPVLTPDGYRAIDRLRPGDLVVGGSRTPRRIMATRVARKSEMARVHLSNGEVVECTADHRWLTSAQEWVEARDLMPHEELAYNDHHAAPGAVTVLGVELFERLTDVYDIQVERDHSFIVADVVVHNSAICMRLDGTEWPPDSDEIVVPGEGTHFGGCRSELIPLIDYERLGLPEPPEGSRLARDYTDVSEEDLDRKVSARRRTGDLGKSTRVSGSLRYEQWLRTQPVRVQEKALGRARARAFREGHVNLKDLVLSDGTLLPIDQLADLVA